MSTKQNKRTCLRMRGRVEKFLNLLPRNQKGPVVNHIVNIFLAKNNEEKLKNILYRYLSCEEADNLLASFHNKKQTDGINEKKEEKKLFMDKPFITFDTDF